MRVVLAKNTHKAAHFVNGLLGEVEAYNAHTKAINVRTSTGHLLSVYPITDDYVPVGRCVYYPVRPACGNTVHKFQGATSLSGPTAPVVLRLATWRFPACSTTPIT